MKKKLTVPSDCREESLEELMANLIVLGVLVFIFFVVAIGLGFAFDRFAPEIIKLFR